MKLSHIKVAMSVPPSTGGHAAPAVSIAHATAKLPGDRCTPSHASATGRAERDADLQIIGWAVNTGGSGPPSDLRTYAQQSSDSNHWAARFAVAASVVSALPAPIARPIAASFGVLSGSAWEAGQSQADRQAACP